MKKKATTIMPADSKILANKTYQDFNNQAPNLADPNKNKVIEIEQSPEVGTDGDVAAIPQVGARDKHVNTDISTTEI